MRPDPVQLMSTRLLWRSGSTKTASFQAGLLLLVLLMGEVQTCRSDAGSFVAEVWLGMYSDMWSSDRQTWSHQVDELFTSLREAGIDTIYFMVKDPWGYVYYESKYAPLPPKYNWDLLKEVVAKARAHNLKIHPYVNALAEGESQPDFYLCDHPDMAIISASGEGGWVDPSNTEYVDRLLSIVEEIATNYDIDGIQLDRIRMPGRVIRAKASEELYKQLTGLSPEDDDNRWQGFIRDQVTQVVARVSERIRPISEDLTFSAAVFPSPSSARANQLQDWSKWVEEGYVDYVCTMAYAEGILTFKSYVDEEMKGSIPSKLHVGIAAYLLRGTDLSLQMKYVVLDSGLPGVVFFNGDALASNEDLLSAIAKGKEGQFEEKSPSGFLLMGAGVLAVAGILAVLALARMRRKSTNKIAAAVAIRRHARVDRCIFRRFPQQFGMQHRC